METCAVDERMRFVMMVERQEETFAAVCRRLNKASGVPIPGEAARRSGMMPPTDSGMISPTVPR